MGFDPRLDSSIERDPQRRQVEPFVVSGKTQTGEWINRLYRRVLDLEESLVLDPNAPPPAKYETGNLPLSGAKNFAAVKGLPPLGGMKVQKEFNEWIYGVLADMRNDVDLIDLSKYATTSWVQSWCETYYAKINHKHPEYGTGGGGGDVDLTGYATEEWVLEQIGNIEIPDAPDVDLTGYATEQWVTEGFAALDHEHEGMATEEWVQEKLDALDLSGGGSGEMPLLQVDGSLAMVRTEDTPWPAPAEGQTWMDPVAMQQMVWWRGQWVPSSPAYGGGSGGGEPDGSGAVPTLDEVLGQGNIAKPGQSIRFSTSPAPISLPNEMAEVLGTIEPGFGSYQGALLKLTYITPEVTIEGDGDDAWLGDEFVNGVYKFESATATQIWTENPDTRGGEPAYSAGLKGIKWDPYKGTDSGQQGRSFWVNPYSLQLRSERHNLLLSSGWDGYATFTIDGANAKINTDTGTIEAKEFIGDGSKLTGLPEGWKHLPDLPDLMAAPDSVAKVYAKRKG